MMYVTYPEKLNTWSDLTTSAFTVIAALNHSKNFAVYCLSSSDMREALREYACNLYFWLRGKRDLDGECGDCGGSDGNDRKENGKESSATRIPSAVAPSELPTSTSNGEQ